MTLLEGKADSISKSDTAFIHQLAFWEAKKHIPILRRIAQVRYPDCPLQRLVVTVDFTEIHPEFSVIPLDEYERSLPSTDGTAASKARHGALIDRVKENPGKFMLIQSWLANGYSPQIMATMITGAFWPEDYI